MKRKLLFVSNLFPDTDEPYRGLDNVTVLHALREYYDIRVVSPRPWLPGGGRAWSSKGGRKQDEIFQPVYVKSAYVPKLGGIANHRLMAFALKKPLQRLREVFAWDHVLTSWLFPDGCAVDQLTRGLGQNGRRLVIAQGSDVHGYLHSSLRRGAILKSLRSFDGCVTRSASLATMLEAAGAEPEKLHPIYNGVDTNAFHATGRAEARRHLGIDEPTALLLFVGNLLPVKDPLMLVNAFSTLRQGWSGQPLRLVMVGKGPLEGAIRERIAQLKMADCVTLTGPLLAGEVAQWMRSADLVCLTSRNEGLPNVVLEAQACGLPVVATDVGGIHEVIDESWKGELVPSGNVDAWARAAKRQLSAANVENRKRIAALGGARTWEAAAEAYRAVLEAGC